MSAAEGLIAGLVFPRKRAGTISPVSFSLASRTLRLTAAFALAHCGLLYSIVNQPGLAQARPAANQSLTVTDPVWNRQYKIYIYGGPNSPSSNSSDTSSGYRASFQNANNLSDGWLTKPSNLIWAGDTPTGPAGDAANEAARGWANHLPATGNLLGFATYGAASDKDVYAWFGYEGWSTPGYEAMTAVIGRWQRKDYQNPLVYGWAYVEQVVPILPSGNNAINLSSNLGGSLLPQFKGGVLRIDQSNQTVGQNFTLDGSSTNAIDANGNSATFSGVFSNEGPAVAGGVTFQNSQPNTPSIITLSADNTYTGPTAVNSGTLAVNGRITSNTTVKLGAILQGTGTIDGDVTNEGTVSPGNSIGTLTAKNFAQRAGATLLIEVNGSDSDLLNITGSVSDLNGKVTIAGQPTPGKVYTGITAPAQYTGGSTANADTGSAIGTTGFQFVRGQSPDFNKLNGSPTYDPTKLQFGWFQSQAVAPTPTPTPTPTPAPTIPTDLKPGQQSINYVKPVGGAITSTITQPAAQSTAQCDANTGNSAACQVAVNAGGTSGASAANANNVEKAKAIDAGMTSVFSAVNTGVTGGAPIPSSTGAPTGYTTNQAKAALVTPDFVTVYSALLTLPTVGQVNQALHAISAEPYASMQSVALEAMEQFRANTLALSSGSKAIPFIAEEQVCQVESGTNTDPNQVPPADCKPRTVQKLTPWSLLIDGTNTQASLNGTNDLASLDYNIFSSSYGLQYDFNRQWSAGAAFGYGRANLYNYEYANVRIDSSTYAGSVWGTYRPSAAWKLTALAGYMNFQYDSDRTINFGGLNRTANASWSGNGFTTALAAEYEWVLANDKTSRSAVRIKPNTFLSYAIHNQGSFSESGAGALNLAVDSHTADSLLYGIGFQIETPIITGKTSRLIPRLSLGYEYDFNGDSNEEHQLTASFAEVPALGSVDVLGQNRGSNALDVGLSLEYETSEKLSLYAGVGGAFWSNGNELSYGGGMRLRW